MSSGLKPSKSTVSVHALDLSAGLTRLGAISLEADEFLIAEIRAAAGKKSIVVIKRLYRDGIT